MKNPGFSLVEVLVALAITAIVSVSILGSISGMTAHITAYRDDTQLALLLEALAHDIALRGIPSATTGSFDTHPDYSWAITVSPMKEQGRDLPFKEIVMTVTSPSSRTFSSRTIHE